LKNETKPVILFADDEPVNQKVFSLILGKLGYNFILADNGEDALEKIKNNDPALVFFDLLMPKMNGFEAAKKLRSSGYKKPIIAVTATFLPEYDEKCKESGIDDILIKPIKSSEIQKMFDKWLTVKTGPLTGQTGSVSASGQSVFNAKEMLDTFMNEEEAVLPLLSRFINRTKGQLENFQGLIASGDWTSSRRDAHTIKGAASTMGGAELAGAAGALEKACLNASVEEAKTAFPRVLEAFEKYKKEAEEYILSRNAR
jgi:CheY-like chemotaxis protein/HPt (histidine-containing phosphotransfer) domain-containing protein